MAEDLTALTFEKAWRTRHRYRYDLSNFSTWLFAIARNVARDYFRQQQARKRRPHLTYETKQEIVEDTLEEKDNLRALSILLSNLSEREQELIALKYGADLTNRAIAELTGLSESNLGTILYRVIRRLQDALEKERLAYEF